MALTSNATTAAVFSKYAINIGGIDFSKTMTIVELFYDNNANRITTPVVINSLKDFINFIISQGLLVDPAENPKGVIIGESQRDLKYNFHDYFGYSTTTDQFTGIGSSLITANGGPGFMTITYDGHTYSIMADGTAPVFLS